MDSRRNGSEMGAREDVKICGLLKARQRKRAPSRRGGDLWTLEGKRRRDPRRRGGDLWNLEDKTAKEKTKET